VLGYGCNPNGKRIEEYLHFVSEIVNPSDSQNIIIACGGFTNPKDFPNISEAGMIAETLRKMNYNGTILKEESSVTTIENLRNAIPVIRNDINTHPYYGDIVIICDKMRSFKIAYLANRILGTFKMPIHIVGFDFQRDIKSIIKHGILGTILDILSCYLPFLENYLVNRRKRRWGINS